jgi:hypothetical protein
MKNDDSSDSVRLNTLNSLLTRAKNAEHYPARKAEIEGNEQ